MESHADTPWRAVAARWVPAALAAITPCAVAGTAPVLFEDASGLVDIQVLSFTVGGNGQVGVAWFDYNNDDWLDLFVTNGCNQNNGLFENNGDGTFSDVSAAAGIQNGQGNDGVIAADIDNDGFQDIFLTGEGGYLGSCVRPSILYHNNGDGTFTDITASAGIVGPFTSFSAAFGDIDNDGFVDLFITGSGQQSGLGPPNKLFLNNGDLTFTDISVGSGVNTDLGGCAVIFTDVDVDGLADILLANCVPFASAPNELFRNNGDLTFIDIASVTGVGSNGYLMGWAPGDYDNDGDIDFFATNLGLAFPSFKHRLYRRNENGTYTNVAAAADTADFLFGWGTTMTDFDNDGWPDIYMAGACPTFAFGPGGANPGNMLFNDADGTFTDHTADMPLDLSNRSTSGLAAGDYDNDGFPDIAVAADEFQGNPSGPIIFHNLGNANHWLTVRLRGTDSNRDGIGARIRVQAGGLSMLQEVYAGSSFLSMDSQWRTFGLGASKTADLIEVTWPSGTIDTLSDVAADQTIIVVEGASQCPADLDGDGVVGILDFLALLAAWGPNPGHAADLDGDGTVGILDFLQLLSEWGRCA